MEIALAYAIIVAGLFVIYGLAEAENRKFSGAYLFLQAIKQGRSIAEANSLSGQILNAATYRDMRISVNTNHGGLTDKLLKEAVSYGFEAKYAGGIPDVDRLTQYFGLFVSDIQRMSVTSWKQKTLLEKSYSVAAVLFAIAALPMNYEFYFSFRTAICVCGYFFLIAGKQPKQQISVLDILRLGSALQSRSPNARRRSGCLDLGKRGHALSDVPDKRNPW